jgi:hypothetical protein
MGKLNIKKAQNKKKKPIKISSARAANKTFPFLTFHHKTTLEKKKPG